MKHIPFLSAEWRNLLVINYRIDPKILKPLVPIGTELDEYKGEYFISLVGFLFKQNKFLGLIPTIPFVNFEEANLRFYVKRTINGECRKGVAFVREVVPSKVLAIVARTIYNEPYVALPMAHEIRNHMVSYSWKIKDEKCAIEANIELSSKTLETDSFPHFILEHYWGYTRQPNGSSIEYQVDHPPWNYRHVSSLNVDSTVTRFYGHRFEDVLLQKPHSAFLAEGSDITVSWPHRFFGRIKIKSLPPNSNVKGWVLYDGTCGFCSWWIPFWGNTIRKTGFDIAPVQAVWAKESLELPEDELNSDIRLLFRDGRLLNGADAYIYGMKRVWWSAPVGFLLGLPILRFLTWKFYKVFNKNRFFVSKICRLPPEGR